MLVRPLAIALCLVPLPVLAWTVEQGGGTATLRHQDGGVDIQMSCSGSGPRDRLDFRIGGIPVEGTRSVLLWFIQPDGSRARYPVDVAAGSGGRLEGVFLVSASVLEFFRQAVSLQVQVNGTDLVLATDMNGSGAGRLAIQEQCGF